MDGKLRNMTSIYILKEDKILMLYRIGSRVVQPSWCGIGGHFEKDELNDAKACVLRELSEEMNITNQELKNLSFRYVTLRLKNNEIRQNYYFFAELEDGIEIELACDEGTPEWVDIDKLENLEMPLTAKYMLEHYFEIGRKTNSLYAGITTKEKVLFTELEEF